ncbi:MAG TPA: MinD/ParA family protein [Campylobacterales bacterium]|nr:MinD/ParA family protein [Campylobacterales bacterium]
MDNKLNIENTQAKMLQELVAKKSPVKNANTKFIAIASGKGGVGKSTMSANIAYALSKLSFKVALFDADIGLANLDVLLNVKTKKNILHVLKGEISMSEAVVQIDDNLTLIPGESGTEILKYATEEVLDKFIEESGKLDDFDFVIIDTGAGIGDTVQKFVNASDMAIIITTPDPTAITDAYAMVKVISTKRDNVQMILNQVVSEKEAILNYEKIAKITASKIRSDFSLEFLGYICRDPDVQKSVKGRFLFAKNYPNAKCTSEVEKISWKLSEKMERNMLGTDRESGLTGFFKRLIRHM